jgi:hypothetical protein
MRQTEHLPFTFKTIPPPARGGSRQGKTLIPRISQYFRKTAASSADLAQPASSG